MRKTGFIIIAATMICISLFTSVIGASAQAQKQTQALSSAQPPVSEGDLGAKQEELLKLLRMSPKLTTVVARDPSLLSNQDYVSRNNPALAQFLQANPEIPRNPDFYLFTNIGARSGRVELALERRVWPEISREEESSGSFPSSDIVPLVVFACILGSLLWLIRVLLENRRWSRIFKLQTDVHGKLIDKFGTSQELLAYMGTDAGSRFLEAAPISVDFETGQRVPSPLARVLTPLQIGIVLSLLGGGFFFLRHSLVERTTPLLVFGTLALMLGIGFIISAGVTWALADHFGMMPKSVEDAPQDVTNGRQ